MNKEKKLDQYINTINKEKMPKEHRRQTEDLEYEQLLQTVRRVKSLREPELPQEDYPLQMMETLKGSGYHTGSKRFQLHRYVRRSLVAIAAAAAMAVIYLSVPEGSAPWKKISIVQAMEQAYEELKAYHGVVEIMETNELGETMIQAKREVWVDQNGNYRVAELEGYYKGMVTSNNGNTRWQLRPEEKTVYLYPSFPDPYRFTFELGSEIDHVKRAVSVKEAGEEMVAGRKAVILEVTPEGGDTYRLWVDKETDLPLQKETAMRNAIQLKVAYTNIEFLEAIPEEKMQYQLPEGYQVVETAPEQLVGSIEEAGRLAGFTPVLMDMIPGGYKLEQLAVRVEKISDKMESSSVRISYQTVEGNYRVDILQIEADKERKVDSQAILGTINGRIAELSNNYEGQIDINSLRWQDNGMEYIIYGNVDWRELGKFAESLSGGKLILPEGESTRKPMVEIPVDMIVEENEQKSVDAGHSPWRLDAAFVAQVFANLLISPEGIVGDYKIPYEDIEIVENTGTEAIAKINNKDTLADHIYMKRLVRQDDTGIWTVVGYDPVK